MKLLRLAYQFYVRLFKKDQHAKTREYTRQVIRQYEKTLRRLSYE